MANAPVQEAVRELAKFSSYHFVLESDLQSGESTIATQPAVLDAVINGSSLHEIIITFYDGEPKSSPRIAELAVAPGQTFTLGCQTTRGLSYSISGRPPGTLDSASYSPVTVLYRLLPNATAHNL